MITFRCNRNNQLNATHPIDFLNELYIIKKLLKEWDIVMKNNLYNSFYYYQG